MARIVTKKTARTRSVQSVKPVSNLEELADVSITGAPGASLDGHLLSFDAASIQVYVSRLIIIIPCVHNAMYFWHISDVPI